MMEISVAIRFLAWGLAFVSFVSGINLILLWRYMREKEAEAHDGRD